METFSVEVLKYLTQTETAMVIAPEPDLEAALNQVANHRGVAPEVLALDALRERFLGTTSLLEPQDEWERRLRSLAKECGISLSDSAVSSEGLYE